MKAQLVLTLFFSLFSIHFLLAQTPQTETTYLSSDEYQIVLKEPHTLKLYNSNGDLLGSYSLEGLPKVRKRMRKMEFVRPEQSFPEIPNEGLSSVFETEASLFFTFHRKIDEEQYLMLLHYDKAQKVFKEETIKYFPFYKPIHKTFNNQFILGDHLFIVHINPDMIHWNIRSLNDPSTVIKEFTVAKGKANSLLNTRPTSKYNRPMIPGSSKGIADDESFFKNKRTLKSVKKLINHASKKGVKIKVNELGDNYIEITLGTQFLSSSDFAGPNNIVITPFRMEELYYFKSVIHKTSLEHIRNTQLIEAGLSLPKELKENKREKKKKNKNK